MKPKLLQRFKAMNDASATAAAADLWPTQLHGKNAITLEHDVAYRDLVTGRFFSRRCFNNGGARFTAKQQRGGVTFRIATDQ